jgi:hypothetical protein
VICDEPVDSVGILDNWPMTVGGWPVTVRRSLALPKKASIQEPGVYQIAGMQLKNNL